MRSASATFRRTMSQRRNFVNYADMTLANGTVLHLTPEDFRIGGNTIQDDVVDGDAFSVGTAIGKTVSIVIDNSSEYFSQFDFYNAVFVLYIGLELPDTTVEKLRIGTFTVITPATTGLVITIDAVDNMYKFDQPYVNTLSFPATLQEIVNDACVQCGVHNNTGHFDRYRMEVEGDNEILKDDITYRQIISYVAQIACVYAKIDEYGDLIFAWYTDTVPEQYADGGNFRQIYTDEGYYATGDALDGGDFSPVYNQDGSYATGDIFDGGWFTDSVAFHDLGFSKSVTVATDDIIITGVRVKYGSGDEETDVLIGTDDYCITVEDNPFTINNERTIAQALWAKLMYLTFRPFSLSYLQDPTIESGDWVVITSVLGDSYLTFCTSVQFTTGGYMQISCNAQPPAKQGCTYSSSAAKAVVKAARETASQISTYDNEVQRMNQLAANAMGNYWQSVTQDDGSVISYLSNKPLSLDPNDGHIIFTNHSHAWKITGDGFFQCSSTGTDESTTVWTGGIDANNNAVMTTVSTIGLNADWINTGTITIGGTSGNVNGKIVVKNSSGTIIGQWDKTGLTVHSGTISGIDMELGGDDDGSIRMYDSNDRLRGEWDKYGFYLYDSSGDTVFEVENGTATMNGNLYTGDIDLANNTITFDDDSRIEGEGYGNGININSNTVVFSVNSLQVTEYRSSGGVYTGWTGQVLCNDGYVRNVINGIICE